MPSYSAFLSFAESDSSLVSAICDLFEEVGAEAFYAPRTLEEIGSDQWRREIRNGISKSRCFLPIYTHRSLRRPWVNYESGVADALGKTCYPARVENASISDITLTRPGEDSLVYKLYERDSLIQLVTAVCILSKTGTEHAIRTKVRTKLLKSKLVPRIVSMAKTRWVFIAGNAPRMNASASPGRSPCAFSQADRKRLKALVKRLTVSLLDHGFNIISCPQVPTVGKASAFEAAQWLAKQAPHEQARYRIGGIYPIDRDARESGLSEQALNRWRVELMAFRKQYLADSEWLVAVGGSDGTAEEMDAAEQLGNVKVFPIPCFGGAGRDRWRDLPSARQGPCADCREKSGKCTETRIDLIAEYMRTR